MKRLTREAYTRARDFLQTQARPIDQVLFRYHFEAAPVEDVLTVLSDYQNEDGGFGHALEPDLRTPASSALASGYGLRILKEIGCPGYHPMVRNAVQYLLTTVDRDSHVWRAAPHDVNDYAHAPWWHDEDGSLARTFDEYRVIPRAEIVGLLHHYSGLVPYDWLTEVTELTVNDLETIEPLGSGGGDDLVYALSLAGEESLPQAYRDRLVARLRTAVPEVVNQDPDEWGTYCISPLKIVNSPDSRVADLIWEALMEHLDYQIEHQTAPGAWDPVWSWGDFYPDIWPQALVEWQGFLTLETLTTLRAFGRIEE